MSSTNLVLCRLVLFAVPALGIGCKTQTARLVSGDPNYAIVAIPRNTNAWPNYNYKQAEEIMQKQFPAGYVIDRQEEFVVGTTQQIQTNTNRTGDPILAMLRILPVREEQTQTTSVQNQTEWRIYVRSTNAPPMPPGLPPQPGPVLPASFLAPTPPPPATEVEAPANP